MKKHKDFKKRIHDLDIQKVVNQVNKIENLGTQGEMPVQKYYRNTLFEEILTYALYELQRKQTKFPQKSEYFTEKGIIAYIADHIMANLPDWEVKNTDNLEESATDIQ